MLTTRPPDSTDVIQTQGLDPDPKEEKPNKISNKPVRWRGRKWQFVSGSTNWWSPSKLDEQARKGNVKSEYCSDGKVRILSSSSSMYKYAPRGSNPACFYANIFNLGEEQVTVRKTLYGIPFAVRMPPNKLVVLSLTKEP